MERNLADFAPKSHHFPFMVVERRGPRRVVHAFVNTSGGAVATPVQPVGHGLLWAWLYR